MPHMQWLYLSCTFLRSFPPSVAAWSSLPTMPCTHFLWLRRTQSSRKPLPQSPQMYRPPLTTQSLWLPRECSDDAELGSEASVCGFKEFITFIDRYIDTLLPPEERYTCYSKYGIYIYIYCMIHYL